MSLARVEALEKRRQRDQSRRAALAWLRRRERISKAISERRGIVETVYGTLIGEADVTRSHHMFETRRYLIFTGGCHGAGSIFQAEEITSAVLKFARGVWLQPDGAPRYRQGDGAALRSEHCVAHAVAGFSILAEAQVRLAEMQGA